MKHISISILLLFPALLMQAQDVNIEFSDEKTGKTVLVGPCNREGLQENEEFSPYFEEYYSKYQPDEKVIRKISRQLKGKDYKIKVVLGSWCHDSKEWVPRFFKITDALNIPEEKIEMICVDTRKKAVTVSIEELDIERVPTFIFYTANGEEAGRIIESPYEKLEDDMLRIVREL